MNLNNENSGPFGIEKQCVEFARRWLCLNKGLIYDEVNIAADIWHKINYYKRVSDGKQRPVFNIANGSAQQPHPGDLIIYNENYLSTGHVSVIVNIDQPAESVCLHEQNFGNEYHLPHQERCIPLINHKGNFWLLDNHLIGWKSLTKNK